MLDTKTSSFVLVALQTALGCAVDQPVETASQYIAFAPPSVGQVTWNDSGQFFLDGVLLGSVSCDAEDDLAIDGTDAEFFAFLDAHCSVALAQLPPTVADPCASGGGVTVDALGYTIDTCLPANEAAGDPYFGGVATWHRVPSYATDYDAHCYTHTASGTSCCNFYRDIDPEMLTSCDAVYPQPMPTLAATGTQTLEPPTLGLFRTKATDALGDYVHEATSTTEISAPWQSWRNRMLARLGAWLIVFAPFINQYVPGAQQLIIELERRITQLIEGRERARRGMEKNRPPGPSVVMPQPLPPPPGWTEDFFKRGGRNPLPEQPGTPIIRPPGGRPTPELPPVPDPVRPPFRPPGKKF